jgi:phospholipid/cholesterol/gamma-HCH transport system substrate-binding protein
VSRLERLYSPPEIGAPGKRAARGRRRDLLLAGAFVGLMLALALGALALVVPGLFGGTYRLHAYFPDAGGLSPGTQVLQDGYPIGMLETMRPVFPGRDPDAAHCPKPAVDESGHPPTRPCFRATLRIRDDWPVPADSSVQLGSAGLLQGEVVKLRPGAAPRLLADGGYIEAAGREASLMTQLSALTDTLQAMVDETIAPALASLQKQIATIEGLLGTSDDNAGNRDRLAGAFQNLKQLTADLEQAVDPRQIATILGSVEQLSANLNGVSQDLAGRTEAIGRAVDQYSALAADIRALLSKSTPGIERSVDDTQYLLQQLAAALTPILTNIEDATRNLSALARDLRSNPAVIIQGREVEPETPWFK